MELSLGLTLTLAVFLLVVLVLVSMLLFVKAKLSPSGKITIDINDGEKVIEVDGGGTLLSTLGSNGIFLPSACGGGGTCVQCTCHVLEGGGGILPTEEPHFSRKEIAAHKRLGCQVKVKENMKIHVEEEILGIKEWEAEVVSNYNVATFIKNLILELPEGESVPFRAGGCSPSRSPWCS